MKEHSPEHRTRMEQWHKDRKAKRVADYASEKSRMADGEEVDLPHDEHGNMKEHEQSHWGKGK
jgi:hypothetical protein